MEGQEFHGGNSITIRWAVTIHEANPDQPLGSGTMAFDPGLLARPKS